MAGSIQISNNVAQAVESSAKELSAQVTPAQVTPAQVTPEDLAKSDLWIFREGRREFSGPSFLRELERSLSARNALLDCLIQAGELESALSDTNHCGASAAVALTDVLADRLCSGNLDSGDLEGLARGIAVPERVSISPPEGFTYYALHPLDFAKAVEQIANQAHAFAMVGIRSIGTTLSAVAAAALKRLGKKTSRITVRPQGHPYARNTKFSLAERAWIAQLQSEQAHFLIVDEGPGRSGSTFLSVAEALVREGVHRAWISIIGSRNFDPRSLCAQDASDRWSNYRFISAPSTLTRRFTGYTYLGGGDWRQYFCDGEQTWPESWTQMERFKVLSPDKREFLKFEGMGRIGKEARERAFILAKTGISPAVSDVGDGFLSYQALEGRHLRTQDLNARVLENVARYCAFRVAEFTSSNSSNPDLEQMLVHNVQEEFGRQLRLEPGQLRAPRAVLVDGRMQPHEWIAADGKVMKTDAISHGDNHFFPGPCGIAWDLVGAIVEWNLGAASTEFLLSRFRQFSGMDISSDLGPYMLAYSVFRLGFCKMARSTVLGTNEEQRLESAYRHYRVRTAKLLETFA
ncbi:MAG TPA: hypothetical protein VJO35_16855 [Terriglobales bacterium]|nr:hypothetical protein [Terriglobales bacterium]